MMRKWIPPTTKWHVWMLRLGLLFIFLAGTSACAPLGHYLWGQPIAIPATGGCDPTGVSIRNVHWFKDSAGAWRVQGEIKNQSSQMIGSLETGVETRTKFD